MALKDLINRIPELEELIQMFKDEVRQNQRPANEVILDDVDLRNFLKVSKRTTAYWREKGLITYSKLGGKIFYRLSDILALVKQYEVPAINSKLKIVL